jgi:hypothetical protein
VSIVAYIPLYLCCRGNITVNPDVWWKFSIHRAHDRDVARTRALGLIAYAIRSTLSHLGIHSSYFLSSYPLVYSVLILPLSAARWLTFVQESHGGTAHVSAAATFAGSSIYSLSGAANVLLFFITRPDLSLFKRNEFSTTHEGQPPSQLPTTMDSAGLSESNVKHELSGVGRLPSSSDLPATNFENHELGNV